MTDFDQALAGYPEILLGNGDLIAPPLVPYEGPAPADASPPYVVWYSFVTQPANAETNAVDGRSRTLRVQWTLHCVGGNREAAIAVAKRVRNAMLDRRPVIDGLECGLIRMESAQQPQPDQSTGQLVMNAIVEYSCTATLT